MKNFDIECKVGIVKGESNISIELENGGGNRTVQLFNYDNLPTIKKKIIQLYFPQSNKLQHAIEISSLYTSIYFSSQDASWKLGRPDQFEFEMLDFQHAKIQSSRFEDFLQYKTMHGLQNRKPLFFIRLLHKRRECNTVASIIGDNDTVQDFKQTEFYNNETYGQIKEKLKDLFFPYKCKKNNFFREIAKIEGAEILKPGFPVS